MHHSASESPASDKTTGNARARTHSRALSIAGSMAERRWKLGPIRNSVSIERDIAVPMRDGVVLLADHYVPLTPQPRPTVLMRCPYGRGLLYAMAAKPYAERGYHVLLQSTRGTFGSGGAFRPYADEAADGQDTVSWLRTQDWFDGRLATVGSSYLAYVQWALALDPPPELRAMIVQISLHDLAASCWGHGPFELYGRLNWSNLVAHQETVRSLVRRLWQAMRAEKRLGPAMARLPLRATADAIGGAGAPWYGEWLDHRDPADEYWDDRRATAALSRVAAPTLLIGGFHDHFVEQTMQQYQALRRRGVEAGLTVGPWTHLTMDVGLATRESLAWLDAFVAADGPSPRAQPVRVWTSGSAQWQQMAQWPPARTSPQTWYLRGGGALIPESEPAAAPQSVATSFRYDPLDPTPSVGGRIASYTGGSRDNTTLEARSDVLSFSTVPLAEAVLVAGVPSVRLFVGCDGMSADVFVRLCDVDERGRSRNLTDQIVRLSAAELAAAQDLPIGLAMTDVSHVFLPGHRIRLQVSGGAFPRFARNLGTDADQVTGTRTAVVAYQVRHDVSCPSALTLPVVADSAAG